MKLRKLKKAFWRNKNLEEAKQLNRKFQLDPRSVYSNFGKMLENQGDRDRLVYNKEELHANQSNDNLPKLNKRVAFGEI